jgi:thiazole tautomerase (transcriptional regulator TenI)
VRTLPRVFAVTTDAICRAPDFAAKLSDLMAIGPTLGIVIRAPHASASEYAGFLALAAAARRLGGSAMLVHGRPDVAAAVQADGVQLRRSDLSPGDTRKVFPTGWIGASVHDLAEAEAAFRDGADFVLAGTVFESTSHPGRPGRGLEWIGSFRNLGSPVIAIGGITRERVALVRDAGASGIAAISAIWDQSDPAAEAQAMIDAWEGVTDKIQLTVNGEPRRLGGPTTLAHLLQELELDARGVVVELNRKIVRRPELADTRLQDGDAVELVHFVGGG